MTEYTIDSEAAAAAVVAGTEWDVFDSATSRIKKVTGTQVASYVIASGVSSGSGTLVATGGTGTLSKLYGLITTPALTQTGQASTTLTITNTTVTVGDIIVANIANGTNTTGIAVLTNSSAGAGVMNFTIVNAATTATNAFAGTLVVQYEIIKA